MAWIRVLVAEVKVTGDIADELGQYSLPVIVMDQGGRRVRGHKRDVQNFDVDKRVQGESHFLQ